MDRMPKDSNDPYPEPIYDSQQRTGGYDIVLFAREYLSQNAAESGADGLIRDLIDEIWKLRGALQAAEDAHVQQMNCEEHEPSDAPETCEYCFPSADDARLKRWAALGIHQTTD